MTGDDDRTKTFSVLTPGSKVHHYGIKKKIGSGGMGEVYLADDTRLDRQVALKFMPAHIAHDASLRARFTREARAAAKLDHPNIVTIYEVNEFNGRPFFAMQFVEGDTLHRYCHDEPLTIDQVIGIMIQILDGLSLAHSSGVVHRDIKTSNIAVDRELRPKILDFGLATIKGGEALTNAGSTMGTVAYMSPEQVRGEEVDGRSDLFSLGVVLYELITGKTPFRRNNDAATLHAIVNDEAEPLDRTKPGTPPELQKIVTKALAKNPEERFQSAVEMSEELKSFEQVLRTGSSGDRSQKQASMPSIAVLPFTNMSSDPDNEYFSDGLTEELLNVLAKNPELKVTGRTSSFAFKGKQEDLRGIGRKLGVETLLEGSVRKSGNRVRITAQLINAADGFHLWSETYDRVLDDIFAVQDDIAGAVSNAMHVTLVGMGKPNRKVNPESYSLTLRARQSSQQMNKESLTLAVELYRKAIELDPENAQAWAGLSFTYSLRIAYGQAKYEKEYAPAREAAERALAIDEQLPMANNAMSWVYAALELRIKDGFPYIQRAFELAPNDAGIVGALSIWEMMFGNFNRAIDLAEKSLALDPLSPFAYRELGRLYGFAGDLDKSERMYEKALEMSPDMTSAYLGISMIKLLRGDFEGALKAAEKEKLAGYRLCGQAVASYAMGRHQDADQQLEALVAEGEHWGFQIAQVYAFRKEIDKTFEWLERAYEIHDAGMPLCRVHPFLKPLHNDPRWPVLLEKLGLAD